MSNFGPFRFAIGLLTLVVFGVLAAPRPASAGNVTVTLNAGPLTVIEGNSITLIWTITNNTGATIFGPNGGTLSGSFFQNSFSPTGDVLDALTLASISDSCNITSLNAGGSCTFSKTFSTTSITGDKENSDSGFQQFNLGVDYVCPNCVGDTDPVNLSGQFNSVSSTSQVTVADTPEPSSLLLLATGLLGLGLFVRRLTIS